VENRNVRNAEVIRFYGKNGASHIIAGYAEKNSQERGINMIELVRQLSLNKKYTLVGFSDIGTPYKIRFVFGGHRVRDNTVILLWKCPGRKFMGNLSLYPRRRYILWAGFEEPETSIAPKRQVLDFYAGSTEVDEKFVPFDVRYLRRALVSIKKKPIFSNIEILDSVDAGRPGSKSFSER
jgi:hypothetical protein